MKNVFRKAASLILSAALVLSMAVTPAMAADAKDPPTAVENCEVSGFMLETLNLNLNDETWLNAITNVVVNDVQYEKGKLSWGSDGEIWNTGNVTGSYGSYKALQIVTKFSFPATILISADGYKDLRVQVTKDASTYPYVYTAAAEIVGGSGAETPDTPENGTIDLSKVSIASSWGDWEISIAEAGYVSSITGVSVNGTPWESTSYVSGGGKYKISGDKLVIAQTSYSSTPAIANGDVITITADGYNDLTFKFVLDESGKASAEAAGSAGGNETPDTPENGTIDLSKVSIASSWGDWEISIAEAGYVSSITGVSVNGTPWESTSYVSGGGKYKISGDKLVIAQTSYSSTPAIANGDVITITADGYNDLTFKFVLDESGKASAAAAGSTGGNETPDTPENGTVAVSDVQFTSDMFGQQWYVTFGEKNNGYVGNITGVTVNGTPWEAKNYAPSAGGAYYANGGSETLVFVKKDFSSTPTVPVLKSGDVITITANGYEDLTFKLIIGTDGKVSVVADDGQGDIYQLHVKIEGSFEAAIVGQKDYDGVSGASTGGATSNKNSSVTVYGARLAKGETPADADWKALDAVADPSTGYIDKCSVSIVPDVENGTPAAADSGMEGVFTPAISSSLSLSGTPKDAGSYLISVTVTDDQGRTATSNALPFRIYTGEETLADQLVLGNLKQYASGKYAWDIMEPWAIKNFGSNVTGETESVRVPADLEAWFGSHESGLYGYLGYDLAWKEVLASKIPQTLYIPNGCDLTITNMEILSSVRIVVENGGKLTLSDSTVQGMIDVQSGGTFSMNYDAYNQKFTTGASVCGQIRLADGAILENAAIYSHANYLANGDLTDRTTHEPVVVANGNVTVKGKVFIAGEEAGDNEIGQTGLLVKDGTLTLADDATLVVYGGDATVQLYPKGGTAIELDNGTITGNGKLVAIGGQPLWGEGGDAVTGTGTISTVEAFLQGATASASNKQAPGQAVKGDVTVISPKQHKENGTVKDTVADDPLDGLYWKTGIDAMPPLDKFVTKDVPNGPEITGNQVTVIGSYANETGAGEYAEGAEVSISAGSRSGYTFSGWTGNGVTFRDASSADTTFIMPNQNVTVTANWTKNSSSSGSHSSGSSSSNKTYAPSVDSAENGDVTVTPKNPAKGDTVTITVKPDSDYEIGTVTVKDADGNTIKVTDKGNGIYTFTQPTSKVTVSVSFVKSTGFADVASGAYYADAVDWAVKNGITNGKANGLFGSNDPCTRAQIVTFLWRAAGSPAPKTTVNPFTDVSAEAYYAKAVLWAVENGITNGTTGTTFSPDAACTRAQCVTFLFRSAVANGLEAVTLQDLISGFSDAASLPGYAVPAMNWALANEIVQGNGGALMPNGTCTRAQIVTFLYRANLGK